MNNNINDFENEEVKVNKNGISKISNIVITSLAAVAFAAYSAFLFEFVALRTAENAGLGEGIGAAVMLIFMVIVGGASVVLSAVGLVWSRVALSKNCENSGRLFIITFVLNALFSLLILISFFLIVILSNSGAF